MKAAECVLEIHCVKKGNFIQQYSSWKKMDYIILHLPYPQNNRHLNIWLQKEEEETLPEARVVVVHPILTLLSNPSLHRLQILTWHWDPRGLLSPSTHRPSKVNKWKGDELSETWKETQQLNADKLHNHKRRKLWSYPTCLPSPHLAISFCSPLHIYESMLGLLKIFDRRHQATTEGVILSGMTTFLLTDWPSHSIYGTIILVGHFCEPWLSSSPKYQRLVNRVWV